MGNNMAAVRAMNPAAYSILSGSGGDPVLREMNDLQFKYGLTGGGARFAGELFGGRMPPVSRGAAGYPPMGLANFEAQPKKESGWKKFAKWGAAAAGIGLSIWGATKTGKKETPKPKTTSPASTASRTAGQATATKKPAKPKPKPATKIHNGAQPSTRTNTSLIRA